MARKENIAFLIPATIFQSSVEYINPPKDLGFPDEPLPYEEAFAALLEYSQGSTFSPLARRVEAAGTEKQLEAAYDSFVEETIQVLSRAFRRRLRREKELRAKPFGGAGDEDDLLHGLMALFSWGFRLPPVQVFHKPVKKMFVGLPLMNRYSRVWADKKARKMAKKFYAKYLDVCIRRSRG